MAAANATQAEISSRDRYPPRHGVIWLKKAIAMRVCWLASGLEVWSPAKLNLFLEVIRKRDDGFHELQTLMCPIDVFDTLRFEDRPVSASSDPAPIECHVRYAGTSVADSRDASSSVPSDRTNTAVRAVEALRQRAGVQRGARLSLLKRIPAQAGLGGGSSNAAAALVAANIVWKLGYSRETLMEVAATIGSDVPFFLARGWAMCEGRGEIVASVPPGPRLHLVVAHPGQGLSTPAVYSACTPAAAAGETPVSPQSLLEALATGNLSTLGQHLHNRLEPPAQRLAPQLARLAADFDHLGLVGHQMSGSGTAYFGICRHARHARVAASRLRSRGWHTVFSTATGI